jgi:hypothetical protein
MTLKQTIGSIKINPLQLIIFLALLQLTITLLTNGFALSADEAIWHYIGRNWFRQGLIPYAGGIDNKSPLYYALFGFSDMLFGVNYWFPRVLGTICQSIGIYYVYKIASHLAGKQSGILAISFYGLSVLWRCADGRYVSYTETYEVLFIIMAFYYCLTASNNKGFFISGLLAAIGLGFRLSALFGIAVLLVASLQKSKKTGLLFCLGLVAGIGLVLLLFACAGINIKDVYTYAVADNYGAGSTTDHSFLWRMEQLCITFFYSEMVLFYPLILIYLFIKKKVDWLILWIILEFIGINVVGNYARVQLKDLLPALSLAAAFAVDHIIKTYGVPVKQVLVIVWICFFPKLLEPLVNLKKIFIKQPIKTAMYSREPYTQPDESVSKQLGLWLKANTKPDKKVFVAGYGATVQTYSERLSPSVYFNVTQTGIAKQRFFKDMKLTKPTLILVPLFPEYKKYVGADLRLFVDALVARDYYPDTSLYSYTIYKIKNNAGQPGKL